MALALSSDRNIPWCKGDAFEISVVSNFYATLGLMLPEDFYRKSFKENIKTNNFYEVFFESRNIVPNVKLQLSRRTGKTTRAVLHFIYHRFFMNQECFIVDFADTEASRRYLRLTTLDYCEALKRAGLISDYKPSDIIIFKSSDIGWWPSKSGKIIYHGNN